jgi:hypothetical protein
MNYMGEKLAYLIRRIIGVNGRLKQADIVGFVMASNVFEALRDEKSCQRVLSCGHIK